MGYRFQVVGTTLLKSEFEAIIVDGRSEEPLGLAKRSKSGLAAYYHVRLHIIEDDGTIWHLDGLMHHRKVTGILREKGVPETMKKRLQEVLDCIPKKRTRKKKS